MMEEMEPRPRVVPDVFIGLPAHRLPMCNLLAATTEYRNGQRRNEGDTYSVKIAATLLSRGGATAGALVQSDIIIRAIRRRNLTPFACVCLHCVCSWAFEAGKPDACPPTKCIIADRRPSNLCDTTS
jgi:hypothetical protein